jgi:hypothetical protein
MGDIFHEMGTLEDADEVRSRRSGVIAAQNAKSRAKQVEASLKALNDGRERLIRLFCHHQLLPL